MWNTESSDNLDGKRFVWDGWSEIQERIFEDYEHPEYGPLMPTEDDAHSKAERVYVLGPSIDEPLMVAIDGDLDGSVGGDDTPESLTSSLNKPEYEDNSGDPALVGERFDFAYYFVNNRMGSIMALLGRDLHYSEAKDADCARILEYYRYSAYGTATVLPAHDDGTEKGLVNDNFFGATGSELGSGSNHAWDGVEDTPLTLTDNNTLMLNRRNGWDVYGVLDARGESYGRVSQFGNHFTFTARRLDPTTGLMHYRYRYYESVAGRFVGRDPLGYHDSVSLAQSLYNAPINSLDPMGLFITFFGQPQTGALHPFLRPVGWPQTQLRLVPKPNPRPWWNFFGRPAPPVPVAPPAPPLVPAPPPAPAPVPAPDWFGDGAKMKDEECEGKWVTLCRYYPCARPEHRFGSDQSDATKSTYWRTDCNYTAAEAQDKLGLPPDNDADCKWTIKCCEVNHGEYSILGAVGRHTWTPDGKGGWIKNLTGPPGKDWVIRAGGGTEREFARYQLAFYCKSVSVK